jgi:small subunit ribosomal protein S4
MSKRKGRKFGISRRIGESLWGKAKDPVNTRNFAPGAHGTKSRKMTDYGQQLQAKQKLKKYYGDVTEKQFRKIYDEAVRRKGDTGHNLIGLLESRLDAFIYRVGFVNSVFASRQFVNHKHVMVNGRVVNIPSYRLKPGDVVTLREKSRDLAIVQASLSSNERAVPDYILFDQDIKTATFNRIPQLVDVPYPVQMQPNLVIEFYSR